MKAAPHSVRLLVDGQDILNGKECRDPDEKAQQDIEDSLEANRGGDPRIENFDSCTRQKTETRCRCRIFRCFDQPSSEEQRAGHPEEVQ